MSTISMFMFMTATTGVDSMMATCAHSAGRRRCMRQTRHLRQSRV